MKKIQGFLKNIVAARVSSWGGGEPFIGQIFAFLSGDFM